MHLMVNDFVKYFIKVNKITLQACLIFFHLNSHCSGRNRVSLSDTLIEARFQSSFLIFPLPPRFFTSSLSTFLCFSKKESNDLISFSAHLIFFSLECFSLVLNSEGFMVVFDSVRGTINRRIY